MSNFVITHMHSSPNIIKIGVKTLAAVCEIKERERAEKRRFKQEKIRTVRIYKIRLKYTGESCIM